ncbi:MAG TPA: hypothetical protein VEW28_01550 [Candidatus Kapabacteria bacterium]|nr:hypothetical protein [Candidatus Kapabacteria bacterium]
MLLLDSQKDELYDSIVHAGFTPATFSFSRRSAPGINNDDTTVINYTGTGSYFGFFSGSYNTKTHAQFSPGKESIVERSRDCNWNEFKNIFYSWLTYLKRELTTPNKWDRLQRELAAVNIDFDVENEKFTYEEVGEINTRINQLKNDFRQIPELDAHFEVVNQKLDHIASMAQHLGKFDWKGLFAGSLVGIIIQLSVPPDGVEKLWQLVKVVFGTHLLR